MNSLFLKDVIIAHEISKHNHKSFNFKVDRGKNYVNFWCDDCNRELGHFLTNFDSDFQDADDLIEK